MFYSIETFFRNVHNLSDGRYAAGIWSKYASFNFGKNSPHYLSPVQAAEIKGWMSGPILLAEFDETVTESEVKETCKLLDLNGVILPNKALATALSKDFEHIFLSRADGSLSNLNESEYFPAKDLTEPTEIDSTLSTVILEGVHEEKPGTADYSRHTAFLEQFNLDE